MNTNASLIVAYELFKAGDFTESEKMVQASVTDKIQYNEIPLPLKVFARHILLRDKPAFLSKNLSKYSNSTNKIWHYPSLDPDNRKRMFYFRTGNHILAGKPTHTTITKYIKEFYPDIEDHVIQRLAGNFKGCLRFIENDDPDGWINTYTHPNLSASGCGESCMTGSDSVNVYAYPNNHLRLAHVVIPDQWEEDQVIARTIVRDDSMEYIRLYVNIDHISISEFEALLHEEGYCDQGNLDGIKVLKKESLEEPDSIVMPYIDTGNSGSQSIKDSCSDYVTLGKGDNWIGNGIKGYAEFPDKTMCGGCGDDEYRESELTEVYGGSLVCNVCLSLYREAFVDKKHNHSRYIFKENTIYDKSTQEWVHQDLIDDVGTVCYKCGDYYSEDTSLNDNCECPNCAKQEE